MANSKKNGTLGFVVTLILILVVIAAISYIIYDGISSKSTFIEDESMADILSETLGKSQRAVTEEDIATLEGFSAFNFQGYNFLTICLPGYSEIVEAEEVDDAAIMAHMKQFDLNEYNIESYSDLKYFKGLKELILPSVDFEDVSFISDMKELETLYIDGVTVGGEYINDLSLVSGLENLRTFSAYGNNVTDISPLASLVNLENIYLDYNKIKDVSPLAGLKNIKNLYLTYNLISDITPLASLDAEKVSVVNLTGNNIDDWSSVEYLGDKLVKTADIPEGSDESEAEAEAEVTDEAAQ